MASLLLCTVTLLCAVTMSLASVELTDQNFYEYAKTRPSLLVDFYAPWCSDCKNLEPEYERAAMKLGSRGSDMARVDCFGAGKCICNKFKIKSWPQLKTFHHGVYTGEYIGQQTSDELANYVNYAAVSSEYVDNALSREIPEDTCSQRHAVATPTEPSLKVEKAAPAEAPRKEEKTASPDPDTKAQEEKPKALKGAEVKEDTESVPDAKAKDTTAEKPVAAAKDNSTAVKDKLQAESVEKPVEVEADKKKPFVESTDKDTVTLNPEPGHTMKACIKCDIPKAGKSKKSNKKDEVKKSNKLHATSLRKIMKKAKKN